MERECSCERLFTRAEAVRHLLLEPLHLLRGDPVRVLRAGESARAHVLGVRLQPADHLACGCRRSA